MHVDDADVVERCGFASTITTRKIHADAAHAPADGRAARQANTAAVGKLRAVPQRNAHHV
jgi:hypothetical protein